MPTPLPVLIAGGGIGGLAAAISLARRGIPSLVLEKAQSLGEIGAGIQLGPNAFHAFDTLGVGDTARAMAVFIDRLRLMDAMTGQDITHIDLGAKFRARFGNPYAVIHRGDLHGVFLRACRETPLVELRTASEVTGYDQDGATVRARVAEACGLPILIYNVIPWNYLDVSLMLRIMDEVPGVVGMKQSAGDLKSVSDLVAGTPKANVVLTGTDALLYPAFALGVDGAISALTTAVPGVCVALWNAVRAGDHKTALDLHRRLAMLWNAMPHDILPACVKYAQHRQGLGLYPPRAPMSRLDQGRKEAIDAALRGLPV